MILRGTVRVPGDKSITHRVLIVAGLASGDGAPTASRIRGALSSLDAQSTAGALRRLGVDVSPIVAGQELEVRAPAAWRQPGDPIDCGNSGTTARLLLGALAAHTFEATLTGDESLRRRPMRRVTDPLARMGATVHYATDDRLPVTIRGGRLAALRHRLPVSSAQLKGSLLLAGAAAGVPVEVQEPLGRSRDHTERLLRAFGYRVVEDGGWIRFEPTGRLTPFDVDVPGDISSAAFLVGLASMAEGGELRIASVGLNPTRTHYLEVLRRMGASLTVTEVSDQAGEPLGDIVVRPASLRGVTVDAEEIPAIIDEIPMLAVLASRAGGTMTFHEAGELRVKESDRLALLARNIRAVGGRAEVVGNDLVVEGHDRPMSGDVETAGDHRLAMAFATLAAATGADVRIDDRACASVSFPGFWDILERLEHGR